MKHAHGSARLRIGNITDVLVGVKLEIDTPYAERPDEGKLDFFVDWYACSILDLESHKIRNLDLDSRLKVSYLCPFPALLTLHQLSKAKVGMIWQPRSVASSPWLIRHRTPLI